MAGRAGLSEAGPGANGDIVAVIPPTPTGKRGGVIAAQEGDRWTVTLTSHFGHSAPMDLEGFRECARTLPFPDIYEVIRNAEPVDEPQTARFPASLRQRYERLDRFPVGYLVFGDAICSFNPIYGQGMSVAALQAIVLRPRHSSRPPPRSSTPHGASSMGNDLRMPEAVGQRTVGMRFANWYIAKLHKAAHLDAVLSLAFHRVAPPSLMHPRLVWRVAKASIGAVIDGRGRRIERASIGKRAAPFGHGLGWWC